MLLLSLAATAAADDQTFGVHGQFTYVEQETSGFNAAYRGPNSLTPNSGAETTDATLCRANDTVGIAAVNNAISGVREAYLNAGGLGILVGDCWIDHPAYNRDRGPVSVIAVRLHAQF